MASAIQQTKKNIVDNQQNLHSQDEIEKLRLKNEELKKNLEREQVLHSMLYKEWKDLDEQRAAKEFELQNPKPKNLFYKYAFYIILILLIPGFIFLNYQKNRKPGSPAANNGIRLAKDSAIIEDSSKINKTAIALTDSIRNTDKDVATNRPPVQLQAGTLTPAVQTQDKKLIQQDTSKLKTIALTKPKPELPLSDSVRDSIYWIGWNAYYKRTANHFKKSSQKYHAWLDGYNDGRNDAKKLLAKDSVQNRR